MLFRSYSDESIVEIGRMDNVMEEYHAIFAERMIQHPAVQRICHRDYSALFTPPQAQDSAVSGGSAKQ